MLKFHFKSPDINAFYEGFNSHYKANGFIICNPYGWYYFEKGNERNKREAKISQWEAGYSLSVKLNQYEKLIRFTSNVQF